MDEICGVTEIGFGGIEWICTKAPHSNNIVPPPEEHHYLSGSFVQEADKHQFVVRYPNRKASE